MIPTFQIGELRFREFMSQGEEFELELLVLLPMLLTNITQLPLVLHGPLSPSAGDEERQCLENPPTLGSFQLHCTPGLEQNTEDIPNSESRD